MRVVFIGGLSTGQVALDYLLYNKHVTVPLIITRPINDMDFNLNIKKIESDECDIINDLNANNYVDQISKVGPDLILVAGWSGLLSKELINIPELGTIGFHPSLLPNDRGISVLAWQIEEGYKYSGISMFYYNEFPDCGDIIAQEKIRIYDDDYINDVLDKCDKAVYNILCSYFPLIRKKIAPRKQQNIDEGNFRRLRNDRDSIIDWNSNGEFIYNKIRAISKPYPGAYFIYNDNKVKVWRSVFIENEENNDLDDLDKIGEIKKLSSKLYLARCRNGLIKIQTDIDINV